MNRMSAGRDIYCNLVGWSASEPTRRSTKRQTTDHPASTVLFSPRPNFPCAFFHALKGSRIRPAREIWGMLRITYVEVSWWTGDEYSDFYEGSQNLTCWPVSVVKRLIRPTEPLIRAVGLISGSWSALSGSQIWSIVSDFYSRLNFGGDMRSSKDFLHVSKK